MFSSYSLDDRTCGAYHISKLNSKKSRLGCERCKSRHVKCDEAKPLCKNCKRHGTPCHYRGAQPRRQPRIATSVSLCSGETINDGACHEAYGGLSKLNMDLDDDPPESKERRLLEAGLMCQYVSKTGGTLGIDDFSRSVFSDAVPEMCLRNEAMIYAMYSLAALDKERCSQEKTHIPLHTPQKYLSMALRYHQTDLGNINSANIDAICVTSCMLRIYAFALLQNRSLQPYTPPIEWLTVTGSSSAVFQEAYRIMENKPNSIALQFIEHAMISLANEDSVKEQDSLWYLLQRNPEDRDMEPWDVEVQKAYEWAIYYLGSLRAAVKGGMDEGKIGRRMIIFPMLMNERLMELMLQGQPRSLAILAHYFAFWIFFEHIWWVGARGVQEVRAIAGNLTGKWRHLIEWPLQVLEQWESGRLPRLHETVV
ncbi:C6 finger domain-containing protein [Talaromyces proteolyticus]|uniref:C6 finger domain-containing protein n=1 Tax=Talaromyces proteolyticus TaxID=1131652 RepID=A0AAD4KQI8_9EURO|nr:C6 finger domain-containing protein [Talaromyces proteolyticus]KAH8696107.1 C6 finger domain-containing protein [Talaromyces proteolyticus]